MSSLLPPSSVTPTTHQQPDSVHREIERTTWYDFASVLLFLVGIFNVIDGITALTNSSYVDDRVLFSSLHAWGWFFLVWGVIQIFAAFAVFRGATWAIVPAVITALFSAVANLAAARTYPIWSVTIVVLDVLVIYGLIVHAHRPRQTAA